jgi:hypothetical protein
MGTEKKATEKKTTGEKAASGTSPLPDAQRDPQPGPQRNPRRNPRRSPQRGSAVPELAVPVLVLLAFGLFALFVPMSNGHTHHESASCRWIPLPWTIWAVAYGGLAASVAALALRTVLGRLARSRGRSLDATWHGRLATGSAVVGCLALLLTLVAVYVTHSQAAEIAANLDKPMCEGLGSP